MYRGWRLVDREQLRKLIESLSEEDQERVKAYIERLKAGEIGYSGLRNTLYTGEFPDRIGGFWSDDRRV
jgi:hypothetical protein